MRRIALPLVVLALLTACNSSREHQPPAQRRVKAKTLRLKSAAFQDYYPVPGRLKSQETVSLASKIQGIVKAVLVREGQHVSKGQVLIKVDDSQIRARISSLKSRELGVKRRIDALKAQLDYAYKNYLRFKRLFKEAAATEEEYDRAKSRYLSLKNQVEALKKELSSLREERRALEATLAYTVIRAPLDGTITGRLVDRGTFINPGVPLITMVSDKPHLEFVAHPDSNLLKYLKYKENLPVYIEQTGEVVKGRVIAISPQIDPETDTFTVRLLIDRKGLHPGGFGRLLIPTLRSNTIIIPSSALVKRGNLKAVYTVDGKGTIHLQIVRLGYPCTRWENRWVPASIFGKEKARWYQVLSGLREGDVIVAEGTRTVREGDTIE